MKLAARSFSFNSFLNFSAQIFGVGISILCIPFIIARIGKELFGLLSLLWVFVGYFSFFDLGIGQAATKFLAGLVASNDKSRAAGLVRSALAISLGLGLTSGIVVAGVALSGVTRLLNISPDLEPLARKSLLCLAVCLPAIFIQSALKSVPLAFHRFDLLNMLIACNATLQWGGSALVVYLGGDFFSIILLTVLTRFFMMGSFLLLSLRLLPEITRANPEASTGEYGKLLRFGGWIWISQVVAPFFSLCERAFIGALLSVAWVTFYSVPYDAVLKLLLIPASLVTTLFPFISAGLSSDEGRRQAVAYYRRSVKYTFLIVLPLVLFLVFWSGDILRVWLGEEFASKSDWVMILLSGGMIFSSLAQLPNAALQAFGRPDLPAKLSLFELPLYVAILYYFTSTYGILGTACAWLFRIIIDTAILFVMSRVFLGPARQRLSRATWTAVATAVVGGALAVTGKLLTTNPGVKGVYFALLVVSYGFLAWRWLLGEQDKLLVAKWLPVPVAHKNPAG